jgi:hypothetical protein
MIGIIVTTATVLGFVIMGMFCLGVIGAVVSWVVDQIRTRYPKFDIWLFDDVGRWNRKQHDRAKASSSSTSGASSTA